LDAVGCKIPQRQNPEFGFMEKPVKPTLSQPGFSTKFKAAVPKTEVLEQPLF
jgi:hypothetical protein